MVDNIASQLKEHIQHRTYLDITNASYTNKIEILLNTIRACEDDHLFNKFCEVLKKMNYPSLAARLMAADK